MKLRTEGEMLVSSEKLILLVRSSVFLKWLIIGGLTKTLDLGIYSLCIIVNSHLWLANVISIIVAGAFNYISNVNFVWKSRNLRITSMLHRYIIFNITFFVTESITIYFLTNLDLNPYEAKLLAMSFFSVVGFFISKKWVYTDRNARAIYVDEIEYDGEILATIIRRQFQSSNVDFVTNKNSNFQIGFMTRGPSSPARAHFHLPVQRTIIGTTEVIYVLRGKVYVSVRSLDGVYERDFILKRHDLVYLQNGIHELCFSRKTHLIEIKQGPYDQDEDKIFV